MHDLRMEERSSGPALDLGLGDRPEPPQPVAFHSSAVAPLQVGQPMADSTCGTFLTCTY
ncbi:hypothetical protein [Actinomadura miaoliensis]|uniref:Uncharacterized protein n=1 Tax=Actinomadura miaoliensis TaxID=430685 RepID=A0ABP7UX17_9ACTN